jgi:alkylation response protein AidB-like acyl-CoA dehydrogenase
VRLRLEPELEEFRDAVAAGAAATVAPLAEQVDRDQRFSPELWGAIRDLGLTRLPFFEEHGGDGGTVRAYAVATREVARYCAVGALGADAALRAGLLSEVTTPDLLVPLAQELAAVAAADTDLVTTVRTLYDQNQDRSLADALTVESAELERWRAHHATGWSV